MSNREDSYSINEPIHMNFHRSSPLIAGTILSFCICAQAATAQERDTTLQSSSISIKYLDQVSGKAVSVEDKLDKQSIKALRQWQKQEARIKRKRQRHGLVGLSKVVSLKAKFFKQTKVQLLYDFLCCQKGVPRMQLLFSE